MGGSYSRPAEVPIRWFPEFKKDLPETLKGKTVVITGTTSGTGFVLAQTVGELGAKTMLLNRPSERATKALDALRTAVPDGTFVPVECDLQSFDSVRRAAQSVRDQCPEGVDVLCNNAGVMALEDKATADGYDVQMQTNHLSHFLLTKELLPLLEKAAKDRGEARVVSHTSVARKNPQRPVVKPEYYGKNSGNLGGDGNGLFMSGARWVRYQQTKLANCVFTYALHDRFQKQGLNIKAVMAHPGVAATHLQVTTNSAGGMGGFVTNLAMGRGQSAEDGAMGIIRCCCFTDVESGDFYGPGGGLLAFRGLPVKIDPEPALFDDKHKELLWKLSCEAIGEEWDL